MRRRMWLQNPETKAIWDLLPDNPYNPDQQGCAFLGIKGMGYKQTVTQEQVDVDYFISAISSANTAITGSLYFVNDAHLQAFQAYIGDFRRQFDLFYSPDGEFEPYDALSSIYRKPVVISQVDKTEKNQYGWYECSTTFVPQSDVWKRNVYFSLENVKQVGEALVYPYTYEHVYGGRDVYTIDLNNPGREVGCVIKITNTSDRELANLEWFIEHSYIDYNNIERESPPERSKWFYETDGKSTTGVILQPGYSLYVDSNPTTQEAKVIYTDGTSQSVVNWQEPSYDYINFVTVRHGHNKITFYIETDKVQIEFYYQEQKELI